MLETVEKLHRNPVHIMTVSVKPLECVVLGLSKLDLSTATDLIQSFLQTKQGSSNIGDQQNRSTNQNTYQESGLSRVAPTFMNSRRYCRCSTHPHPKTLTPPHLLQFLVEIHTNMHNPLPRQLSFCRLLPPRPSDPYLQLPFRQNDTSIRRISFRHSRNATSRHCRVQSRGYGIR